MKHKPRDLTPSQICRYAAYLREQERAPATIRKYVHDLTALLNWLDGTPVTKAALVAWKEELTAANDGTNTTSTNDGQVLGGAIYVATGGTVTLQGNVKITGNKAASSAAGGHGLGGGVYNAGAFMMHSGAIYGNSAAAAAADFYNVEDGRFTLPPAKKGYAWYQDEPENR